MAAFHARDKRDWRKNPRIVLPFAHLAQISFLLWIAVSAKFCCDAGYYVVAGRSIWESGLLWQDPSVGYRFYFVPLIFGALERILRQFFPGSEITQLLPIALAVTFCAISLLVSVYVVRREGGRRWLTFAIPILFNPFILAIVPYPLEESVIILFCMPLLLILLARKENDLRKICVTATLFAGIAFMARSSFVWVIVPTLIFVISKAIHLPRNPIRAFQSAALAMVILITLLAPQCYISWHKFDTLNPLAETSVGQQQIQWGIEMLTYSTIVDSAGGYESLPVWSPYRDIPIQNKTLMFYFDHPSEGIFLAITHMWSGFHYVSPRPYVRKAALGIISPWLMLSALIVAYGVLGLFRLFSQPDERAAALLLLFLTILSCAYTAFVATENRFGLLGFTALSVAAWQLVSNRKERKFCLHALPLVAAYLGLCIVLNALLLYRTPVLWPDVKSSTPASTISSNKPKSGLSQHDS